MGRIRIGVSGWNYDSWRGSFYPDDLPRREELRYAGERFDTLEVNATFYRLATPQRCRRWRDAVPADVVLVVKGSRFITHNKKLAGAGPALANFLASGILALDTKLGPILWQLPEQLHFDAERVDGFLSALPHDTDSAAELARGHDERVEEPAYGSGENHRLRHVLEVRHDSYLCEEMVTIARRHGVALAVSHAQAWPHIEEVTAGFVYVRLHGPDALYASSYGEDELRSWAERLHRWRVAEQPADARTITDRAPPERRERDVYVYFDNDVSGYAPRNAARLRALVAEASTGHDRARDS
ncbi:MAG: DUF72 domain-containing protein [Nitriliruptoraceae bacterium]